MGWDGRKGKMEWDGTIRLIKVIVCEARRSYIT